MSSLSDYQIVILSPWTGAVTHIFDSQTLHDLKYDRALDDVGVLVMTLSATDAVVNLFPLDTFVEVQRTSPVTGKLVVEDTYLARFTHRFREGNEERLVVGAVSLNHLILRRLIDPDDDPLAAAGYSTKASTADEVMRAFAREQMGDLCGTAERQYPHFTVGVTPGTGLRVGKRARYDNLLETFQALALQGQTDFIIKRVSDNNLRLMIEPIGRDRTKSSNYPFSPFTQFDPDRGNLANPSLQLDAKKEQNFCYALGQGQGDTRIVGKVAGDGLADSPYNRIEFTADIRQSDRSNSLYLLTGARDALQKNRVVQEFTFDTVMSASGAIYRLDYDLGDKITVRWDDTSLDLRVTDVEITLDSSGESINPKLEPYQI